MKLHRDITKETLENPEWEGKYRDIQVYVGNKITGEIIFTPPPSNEVPILMEEFLTWLIELDIIERRGSGKAIYYVLK